VSDPKRIVYTIAVGRDKHLQAALGLGRSLRLIGDRTRRVVVTDRPDFGWSPAFDQVIPWKKELKWIFFEKLSALEDTDADQVLFLDADMLAFKRLDLIFDACAGKGLCVQGQWTSTGDWYGDIATHCQRHGVNSLPQFNGGLIYYERTDECQDFIKTVWEYGHRAVELGFSRDDPLIPDEPCIALAIAQTGLGNVIPEEANFHNSATGLIGKLDLDITRNRCRYLVRRFDVQWVEPYVFHASRYMNFFVYWRQLDALAQLAKYEEQHGFGYMPPLAKLRRSIERRILTWRGRL
jgi:hypothetical protein